MQSDVSRDPMQQCGHVNYYNELQNAGKDLMEEWFYLKYNDDLSDIRRESYAYYKYYVYNFIMDFFSKDKVEKKKLLDFGCGPGFYSAILAQRGANVIGIDKSEFLITKANEHKVSLGLKNVEFIHADFLDFSSHWESKSFDYIIAIDTLVSFDFRRKTHNHKDLVRAFHSINRLLKPKGKFLVVENHPCFGRILQATRTDIEGNFCIWPSAYKIEYKSDNDPHHWFTLAEMTKATSESGLAVSRIYEPDPDIGLKSDNSEAYSFRLRYPGMIVYEICKLRDCHIGES
jgi:SAM-dependent methyltransferase